LVRGENQRLLQAIRVGHIGIFEHDHDSDYLYWSLELREMYGWDTDELVTLPKIIGAAHHEDVARIISSIRAAHDPTGDGLFDIEHRVVNRQGSVRWLITRSQTLFETSSKGRRPRRTIGAVQDVTEHRLAEERLRVLETQLVHAKKMESIGRLAGGVAHDFNNMLTVISGSIGLTLAELSPDSPCRECLEDAAQAARSAAGLTRQLLAFARKEVIAPQVLDLGELMRRVRRMITWLVGDEISVETRLAPDLRPIRFDPAQLEQVVLNLAVNARDAMAAGGRLTIEASNVFLSEAHSPGRRELELAAGHYVLLSVADTGHGMTDEVRAHLFEPFFTTKEVGKGTGLGLSTVYGAVQQNGGAVELESELGHGSIFKIYLPAASGTLAPRLNSDPPSPSAHNRQASILLVDDDVQVTAFTKTVL
jgi:PAS domain S-box-containing protein